MTELDSIEEAFKRLDSRDEVILRTESGTVMNREVKDVTATIKPDDEVEPLDKRYLVGPHELNKYLVHAYNTVVIKEGTREGLETNGDEVETLINFTDGEWFGDRDFAERALQK